MSFIAAGGMGEVWSATDELLGRNVAVKVLRREYAEDPEFLQRFRAEAQHTAALSHPGIATVYDYYDGSSAGGGAGTSSPYLVMENVPGEPLSALLTREGALTEDRTLDIIGQTALALQAAHHAGVIHRDVKPGNILIRPDGVVKITDFGISRATNSVPLTATGVIMGTAFYLSPEQALGHPATPAVDIYSLGVVAYECLTGTRPFPGETPAGVALAQVRDEPPPMGAGVRAAVASLVLRMLAKDPEDRPSSAGQLALEASDVRTALDQPPAQTRALPATAVSSGPRRLTAVGTRHRIYSAAGLALGALVLLLVVHSCSGDALDSGSPTPSATSPTAAETAPGTVLLRADDYVGEPVAEVTAALRALDLTVSQHTVPAKRGMPVGTVAGVTPTGALQPGETVSLEVTGPGPNEKPGKGHKLPPEQSNKDERKQGKP